MDGGYSMGSVFMQRQKTANSQFGLTSGIRQATSDFIAVPRQDRSLRMAARKGRLWMLTDPASPSGGAAAAAKLVMEAVEDEYYQSSAPSITT
ncbi:MAG: hypothetical protein M3281_02580, partial [Chloroflexota bacterium]|nr:hypothetical protein [Chloroflexota bacterium]